MRMCWHYLVCASAAVFAGAVVSSELSPLTAVNPQAGEALPLNVRTNFDTVNGCYLISPEGDVIEFMPEDKSGDDFELRLPMMLYGCQVTIRNVNENDSGVWELYYTSDDDVRGSHYYDVTVAPRGNNNENNNEANNSTEKSDSYSPDNDQSNHDSDPEVETENSTENQESQVKIQTTDLTKIDFIARMGINISITLSKKEYAEECSLRTPQGETVRLETADVKGVTVYPASTSFVSCRAVIGPIDGSMVGTWTLCGRHSDAQGVYERCQPAAIDWAVHDPDGDWEYSPQASFDHPVHFGGMVNPGVRGRGLISTCHVVTPGGEDIALLADSDYPGLQRVVTRDTTSCVVNIGTINEHFLGDWVLYGTFDSNFGFNVVTLPMHFYLYDNDNPYNQAYNITNLEPETHVVNLGNTIIIEVVGAGTRNDCLFETNSGERYDENSLSTNTLEGISFVNMNNRVSCRLQLGPVTENMLGEWRLIGKFNRNSLFNELQLPFEIQQEDPVNPVVDETRPVEYLDPQTIQAKIGESHVVFTATGKYVSTESCHIRTPDHLQYTLMEGFSVPGVEIATGSGMSCGVRIHVDKEGIIGDWMLIARLNIRGSRVERRLPFTINVEDHVAAIPAEATIAEGNDLYVRLEQLSALPETCVLKGPEGVNGTVERDPQFPDKCGFIVKDVTFADSGNWQIVYGNKIRYIATIAVTVTERSALQEVELTWTEHSSVNETIGPEDAVYCRLLSPRGVVMFEGFSLCQIVIERVNWGHIGTWKMTVGLPGRVLTQTQEFVVKLPDYPIRKLEAKAEVTHEAPAVVVACSVLVPAPVTACKFRDPAGRVLLAGPGVGEDRFTTRGARSVVTNVTSNECRLRISNPTEDEMGYWRCAVATETDTHYGFPYVVWPWAMSNFGLVKITSSAPTLTADISEVYGVEEEPITMSCSIPSEIDYCYFRSPNGTLYNVNPSTSGDYEYAGEGFDAGECGIRFESLPARDSGRWSCHAGVLRAGELQANLQVYVEPLMTVEQYMPIGYRPPALIVEGRVHDKRHLELCRFVRSDGFGFSTEEMRLYEDQSALYVGLCRIKIENPTSLERQPWTVVARISQDLEISRSTLYSLPDNEGLVIPPIKSSAFVIVWSCVLVVSLLLFFVGLLLGPKKSRQWTYRRASSLNSSIRKSFIKKALPVTRNNSPATPNAA